jgi:integrase
MKRLTDATLRSALKNPPAARTILQDGTASGLELRLGPGSATWSLTLRVMGEGGTSKRGFQKKGKRYRVSLGEYPAVSLEDARGRANFYLAQANKGVNPVTALEASATAGGLTVGGLSEKFLTDYVALKGLRALPKYTGAITVHITPRLGTVIADLLTREQVREFVKKVMIKVPRGEARGDRPRGGKEATRTALGVLRKMINWGRREELILRKDNPADAMEANLPKKRKRERVLSLEEAQIAWAAAETLEYPFGPVYRLIMLSGCRPGEWSAALRSWIDLPQGLNVIPADVYKTDHVHVVPLVGQAVRTLEHVFAHHPTRSGNYIFSGTDGARPLAGWSKAQQRLMRAMYSVSGEHSFRPFTPHDLRRTVATRIAEQLGVGGEQLIKRVLGHSDGSVTAIYNRYGYVKEMRAVLEKWETDLTAPRRRVAQAAAQIIQAAA